MFVDSSVWICGNNINFKVENTQNNIYFFDVICAIFGYADVTIAFIIISKPKFYIGPDTKNLLYFHVYFSFFLCERNLEIGLLWHQFQACIIRRRLLLFSCKKFMSVFGTIFQISLILVLVNKRMVFMVFLSFLLGLEKGYVGTVSKPVIGVIDLASETAIALRKKDLLISR